MYHIIVNPSAGRGKAKRNLETVAKIFGERGAEYRVYETAREREASEIAARLTGRATGGGGASGKSRFEEEAAFSSADSFTDSSADSFTDSSADSFTDSSADSFTNSSADSSADSSGDFSGEQGTFREQDTEIVVVGGDGTLHEVLNGLREPSRCRLGIIPSGTGNDFAEAVKIPLNAEKAALNILDGRTKETDFLNVGGVRCLNVGGLGMDVDVLVRCKKGRFFKGKIKYLISLLQSLFTFKGYEIEMEIGGKRERRKALIAVACNGTQIGGGIRICPAALPDDGKIDVMAVDCMGKMQIIKAFSYLMKGRVLEYPAADHYLCEQMKVVPAKPCTVQLDGELYDGLDFDVKIGRGLKIYR